MSGRPARSAWRPLVETAISPFTSWEILICWQGKDAVPFLEQLVVGDIQGITNGSGSLSMFTNEQGGIIDDTVVTKVSSQMCGWRRWCCIIRPCDSTACAQGAEWPPPGTRT